MARWFIRKPTFSKVLGAYRSQGWRSLMRLIFPWYGKKGMGWLRNPRKAAYNWWYNRTSFSLFSRSSSKGVGTFVALLVGLFLLPFTTFRSSASSDGKKRTISHPRGTRQAVSHAGLTHRTDKTTTSVVNTTNHFDSPLTAAPKTKETPTNPSTHNSKPSAEASPIHPAFRDVQHPAKETPAGQTPISQAVPPPPPVATPPEAPTAAQTVPCPADETIPKSTPLDPADRYIRKRMLIAGTYFADQTAVNQLTVGAHIDLTAEPDNPHDPNAVALHYQGGKVGYVAKQDALSFAMCLRLKRPVYGVITDIRKEGGHTVYEYETWFAAR